MKRWAVLLLCLPLLSCGNDGYAGPVVVHARVILQSSFATSAAGCRGTGALTEYAAGRPLMVENQDSRVVASPILPAGALKQSSCEFRITVTLLKGDRSLWLPKSELGITGCRSSQRGATIVDRSITNSHVFNSAIGLPPGPGSRVPARCT